MLLNASKRVNCAHTSIKKNSFVTRNSYGPIVFKVFVRTQSPLLDYIERVIKKLGGRCATQRNVLFVCSIYFNSTIRHGVAAYQAKVFFLLLLYLIHLQVECEEKNGKVNLIIIIIRPRLNAILKRVFHMSYFTCH